MNGGVLILHHGDDHGAMAVERELRCRSVPVLSLDLGLVPEACALSLEDDTLLLDGKPLGPFQVVLNRSGLTTLGSPAPGCLAERSFRTWYGRYIAEKERLALVVSAVASLEASGAWMLNPLEASDLAAMRPLLLDRLRRAGIGVAAHEPATGLEPFVRMQHRPGRELVRVYRMGARTLAAGRLELEPGMAPRYAKLQATPAAAESLAAAVLELAGAELAAVDLEVHDGHAEVYGWDPAPGFALFEQHTGLAVAAPLAERIVEAIQ